MKRRFFATLRSRWPCSSRWPQLRLRLRPKAERLCRAATAGATESDKVTWELEQNNSGSENPTYTLTISGSGKMADFTSPTEPNAKGAKIAPWYTALPADENTSSVPITEIKIEEGVTYLGTYAFSYQQT